MSILLRVSVCAQFVIYAERIAGFHPSSDHLVLLAKCPQSSVVDTGWLNDK